MKAWALTWCQRLIDYVNDWESGGLIDLLRIGTLRINPEDRLSAAGCLKKGRDLSVLNFSIPDSGSATPTRQTVIKNGLGSDEGSSTMILSLPGSTGVDSDYDKDSKIGCCDSERSSTFTPSRADQVLRTSTNGNHQPIQPASFCTTRQGWPEVKTDTNLQLNNNPSTSPMGCAITGHELSNTNFC